jgi:hypothetical protein
MIQGALIMVGLAIFISLLILVGLLN